MNAWGYGLMTVSTVLFWALVIFRVVALVRYLGRGDRVTTGDPHPRSSWCASRVARSTRTSTSTASMC
jgi:hypothetical protein